MKGWHENTKEEFREAERRSLGLPSRTGMRAKAMREEMVKPFREGQEVHVTRHVPGLGHVTGEKTVVHEVRNNGTKSKPIYRYRLPGGWVDHDAISEKP